MIKKTIVFFIFLFTVSLNAQVVSKSKDQVINKSQDKVLEKESVTKQKEILTVKADTFKIKNKSDVNIQTDTVKPPKPLKLKLYKKNAHASYYSDKLNGKKTASGQRFDNSKYTAAHKKLPFGTKIKVTNEANGKSVIVEVTDRGPFSKVREIDITKKAFKEIVDNKNSGSINVTIEVIEN